MPISDERKTAIMEDLRQSLAEIDRLAGHTRELLDELEGKKDLEIEARVAAAIAALRAKSRAKKAVLRK